MIDEHQKAHPREPTPKENKVVILALVGFFAIVLAVAIVPSVIDRKKEEIIRQPPSLPPRLKCMEGTDEDNKANCQRAIKYEKSCRKGDPESCWRLAGFYLEDDNREFNRGTGMKWLHHACEIGSKDSCDWLADLLGKKNPQSSSKRLGD